MIDLKNKKIYITFSITILTILILIAGFYCVKSKFSLSNEMLKIQENYLKNYSKKKFVKKTLKNSELYNINTVQNYILQNFDKFLQSNIDLSSSIKNYIKLYKSSFDELSNLKNIGGITSKDYREIHNLLNKMDYSKINDKLLYITLKSNSNDILAQKNFFHGIVSELDFKLKEAKNLYSKSVELNAFEAKYYNNLGQINYRLYKFDESIRAFNEGLNLSNFKTKKNKTQELQLLYNLAKTYQTIHDFDASFKTYVNLLINSININDSNYEWISTYNIALINSAYGNYNVAIDYLKYALKLAIKKRDNEYIAKSLNALSNIEYKYGDYTNSKINGLKAIKYAKKISNLGIIADSSLNVCLSYNLLGKNDLASIYCNKSVEINNILAGVLERPTYYLQNAFIYSFPDFLINYKTSFDYYKKAYDLSKRYNLFLNEIISLDGMSHTEAMLGNFDSSKDLTQKAEKLEKKLYIENYNCRNCNRATLSWRKNDKKNAIKFFKQAISNGLKTGNNLLVSKASSNLAALYYNMEDYSKALKYSTLALEMDKKIYRFDHHYINYQEAYQKNILEKINNKKGN